MRGETGFDGHDTSGYCSCRRVSEHAIAAWARLIRVEQALLEKIEADLRVAGLPPLVWYDVLRELLRVPGGRLRHRELHRRMLLTKYNLSRLIDRMCAAGLVARSPVEDDGRGPHIGISEAGRCMQKRMCPVYARGIAQHFADQLEEQEIVELGRILQKLQ